MSDRIRTRVVDLATRGDLTIQQVDYLLGRAEEMSGAEADLLIRAFLAENADDAPQAEKRTPRPESIGDRIRGFTGRFKTMSADDVKRTLNEEYLSIERNPRYTADEKVGRVINVTAAACAGVTIQPIPLVEFMLFTPLQCVMAWKISNMRGVRVPSEEAAMESLKTTMGAVGLSVVTQSAAATLLKLGAPGVGGLVGGPLIYGLTYGVGRVMDLYYTDRAAGRPTKDDDLRDAFRRGRDEGDRSRPRE